VARLFLIAVHLGVGALWLGSMAYSLFVVQPRVARLLPDPMRAEDVYRELAAGNRWRVVALIATLGGTGVALALVTEPGPARAAGIAAKGVLWLGAATLFWWVSWRGWPRRLFALPDELPAEQARFRRVALAMTALVAAAFALGVLVTHAP
jgi:hypothetical protein